MVGRNTIFECQFCGALEGEAGAVNNVFMEREAERRGIDTEVYPLVQALEQISQFRVRKTSGGSLEDRIPPFVYFRIDPRSGGLRQLEHLLQSLEMSRNRTHRIWAVEAHFTSGELQFALRPRFMKQICDLEVEDIQEAREDLRLLADRLERDRKLSWWS